MNVIRSAKEKQKKIFSNRYFSLLLSAIEEPGIE